MRAPQPEKDRAPAPASPHNATPLQQLQALPKLPPASKNVHDYATKSYDSSYSRHYYSY